MQQQHPLRLRPLPTMVAPRRRRRRRRPPSKSFSTIVFRSQNRIYILQKTHEPPEKEGRQVNPSPRLYFDHKTAYTSYKKLMNRLKKIKDLYTPLKSFFLVVI